MTLQSNTGYHILDYLTIKDLVGIMSINKRMKFILMNDSRFSLYFMKRIKQ
jgi:hypothetical protein